MIAAALVVMTLAAIATASSVCLGIVRAQRETIAATQLIQERLETLRAGDWALISDAEGMVREFLAQPSSQSQFLNRAHEVITVTPYPPLSPAPTPLQVERRADGTTAIVSKMPRELASRSLLAVRIDLHVDWVSRQNQRSRSRETTSVISISGALR